MNKEIFTKKEWEEIKQMQMLAKKQQQNKQMQTEKKKAEAKRKKIINIVNIATIYAIGLTIIYLMACYIEKLN